MNTNTDENTLTMREIRDEILELWDLPMVPLIMGPYGVGKTAIVKEVLSIKATGAPDSNFEWHPDGYMKVGDMGLINFRISHCDEHDIGGIPMPENGVTIQNLPQRLPTMEAAKDSFPEEGILFFDEFNHADERLQKPMYSIMEDRSISGVPIKPGWRIIAAGNPPSLSSHSYPLGDALKNRLIHYRIRADYEDFKQWAFSHGIHPAVTSFLKVHGEFLCKTKPDSPEEEAFPTPRTWEFASIRLYSLERRPYDFEKYFRAFSAIIGMGAASSFCSFIESTSRFDVEAFLGGKSNGKYMFDESMLEDAWSFCSALMSHIMRENSQTAFSEVLNRVLKSGVFEKIPEYEQKLLVDMEQFSENYFKGAVREAVSGSNRGRFVKALEPFVKSA